MFKFEKSVFINQPIEEVFEFLTDPANDSKWREVAESREWSSDGPIRVGSTQRSVSKMLGRKIETTTEVTAWNPPQLYGSKSIDGPIPFEATQKFESQDGGTLVTFSGQAEISGFFKLAEGLVGKQLEKTIEKDLNDLKQYMEGGQG